MAELAMKTITELLLPNAERINQAFRDGVEAQRCRLKSGWYRQARMAYMDHRHDQFGFERIFQPLLTHPSHNAKLAKGTVPSYGLTLQHHVQRISKRLVVNACPHAGDCVKVCVLDNGHGSFETVQRGRRSKTSFLVQQPRAFAYLLGWELAKVSADSPILFRPNVNSDIRWDLILPSMVDGSVLANGVMSYGYSKDPFVLDTNGWVTPLYRLAYSWNEHSDRVAVAQFIKRGGSLAVVSSRKKGDSITGGRIFGKSQTGVVDADLTDEWMFQEGVIGDLSAKGRARKLIGSNGFVVSATVA